MTAQEIKSFRLRMSMSQEDFARLLGVKLQSVNRWENNKGLPGLENTRKLEELYRRWNDGAK